MNEISMPQYLLLPALICVLSLIVIIYKKKKIIAKSNMNLFIAILAFLSLYLCIVGNSLFYNIYYQWNLNKYDLNKDGMFVGNEINENQKIALQKLASDTGRNFSFIIGLIFSFIISFFLYIMLSIRTKLEKRFGKT
ncbi:hypothetical protein [Flavobacterium granuli]|uniref:DUF4199 domain-containing protein n=1 Tax=Flavobacterium granuli TaxID=280093 RepID=A0A1M5R1X4_9FLAO|nr:hypothetical protein [Flavobacterium granuli]PRZ21574.1 hypothetical protein BC624_10812 [Flavobacterium granuli]SHH20168.1 hypothetical protein SAMN05443373_10912 [Flavobacterium granuli]